MKKQTVKQKIVRCRSMFMLIGLLVISCSSSWLSEHLRVEANAVELSAEEVLTDVTIQRSNVGYLVRGSAKQLATVEIYAADEQLLLQQSSVPAGEFELLLAYEKIDPGQRLRIIGVASTSHHSAVVVRVPELEAVSVAGLYGRQDVGYRVIGTAEYNVTVIVQDAQGHEVAQGQVYSEENDFEIPIAADNLQPKETLTIYSFVEHDRQRYTSPSEKITVPSEKLLIADTELSREAAGYLLAGQTNAQARVEVRDLDGKLLAKTQANFDGSFESLLAFEKTYPGQKLAITARVNGKESPADRLTIPALAAPDELEIHGSQALGYQLTGTVAEGATVLIRDAKKQTRLVLDQNQPAFAVTFAAGQLTGKELTVSYTMTRNGKKYASPASQLAISEERSVLLDVTLADNGAAYQVCGRATANAIIEVRDFNDAIVVSKPAGSENFTCSIAYDKVYPGQQLLVIGNADGVESPSVSVTVPELKRPYFVSLHRYFSDWQLTGLADSSLLGTFVIVENAQGEELARSQTTATGQFTLDLAAEKIAAKEELTLSAAVIRAGELYRGPACSLTVPEGNPLATSTPLLHPPEEQQISGYGVNGAVIQLALDGVVIAKTPIVNGNQWSLTLNEALRKNQLLAVVASEAGKALSRPVSIRNTVVFVGQQTTAPVIHATVAGEQTISGTSGAAAGTAVSVQVDAQPVGIAIVSRSGEWSLPISRTLRKDQLIQAEATAIGRPKSIAVSSKVHAAQK